jgi:hypothetical protein
MNFERLFQHNRIPYSTKVNRGWVNVKCPECGDKSFNLGFNITGNYAHCWRCGGKELYLILSEILNIPYNMVYTIIDEYKDNTETIIQYKPKKTNSVTLPTNTLNVEERKYLKTRGYNPLTLMQKYGVVGGGISGKWKYRIIVPVFEKHRLVSFLGRSILTPEQLKYFDVPRYKNLSEDESLISVKNVLFNADNCKNKTAVMLEGSFDVFRFGDDSFCCLGSELTQTQINKIANKFDKVFILFDNEKEAQIKAKKYGLILNSLGVEVEIVDCFGDYGKNDCGELTDTEVLKLRKELHI